MTVTHTPPYALVVERRIAGVGGWSDASSALAIRAA
jgi:hypothetical protein